MLSVQHILTRVFQLIVFPELQLRRLETSVKHESADDLLQLCHEWREIIAMLAVAYLGFAIERAAV